MQATSSARQVRSQPRQSRSSLRCFALEQRVPPSVAASQQGAQLPTWVKHVAATAVLVPTIALGVFGGNAAHARGKAKEVAPTVTVVENKKEENPLAAVWAKPEVKGAAGAAATFLLLSLLKGTSSESSSSKSSAAPSTNGSVAPTSPSAVVTNGSVWPPSNGAAAPFTNGAAAPFTNGAAVPVTKVAAAPVTNGAAAPVAKVAAAPVTNGVAAPSPKVSVAPVTNGVAAPSPKVSIAPFTNAAAAPSSKVSAAAVSNDAPISVDEAKDIINTVIVQEFYRVSDSAQDSVAALNDRTAGVFNRIMQQHTALRKNKSLLSKHASIEKLLATVVDAGAGKSVPVWSLMYDKQAILKQAEGNLNNFLADIKQPYPDLHTVLTSTSPDFAIATLCALGAWALRADVKANA